MPTRHTGSICQLKQQIKHVKSGKRENNKAAAYRSFLKAGGISGAVGGKNLTPSGDAGFFDAEWRCRPCCTVMSEKSLVLFLNILTY